VASKSKNVKEDKLRTLGRILEVLAVAAFITVNLLRVISNQDPAVINVLSVIAVFSFISGLMLSHLPEQ
jgi:hypothetical protein